MKKKICELGMVTEPGVKQSGLMKTNIIPNDNILGVLLLPWCEFLHLCITGNDYIDH